MLTWLCQTLAKLFETNEQRYCRQMEKRIREMGNVHLFIRLHPHVPKTPEALCRDDECVARVREAGQ